MAISEFLARRARNRVGFVRDLPGSEICRVFEKRGYECFLLNPPDLKIAGLLDTTDAVIVSQNPEKPSHFKTDLKDILGALDYDCRIYVRYAPDLTSQSLMFDAINTLKLPFSGFAKEETRRITGNWFDDSLTVFAPFVHFLTEDDYWDRLANLISANPAGKARNPDLKIDIVLGDTSRTDEAALLLQRAFADCSSITLRAKTNGLSGVDAFEAFAYLTDLVGSPSPYRCFVKLGPRVKVAREFQKYRSTALEQIPFHLGPRLRADRCVLGKSLGLITCDYVGGAETLRDSIRDGRAVHVVGNLFNQTLISWRRAAKEEKRPLHEFLVEYLQTRASLPEHREPHIKALGATKTLAELKALLADAPISLPVLSGVIHGDLHATNVLVRMNDAIIIDLESIETGKPLLIDAASLEGGLFVDGFIEDFRPTQVILESIMPLYTAEALNQDDHYCNPADESAWFVDSVRQIRMQARQMERHPYQYGWTLAAVLLRKSANPDTFPEPRELVRAMAFVLAEKIILSLSQLPRALA